jgi:ATP-dependent Clp protease ATP-binding subunit ClpC
VDLEVAKVIERVRAKDIRVQLDTTAVDFLIDRGYDPTYGARPMRRAVKKYLEDPQAEEFLRGNIKQGDTLVAHAAGERLAFKLIHPEQSEPEKRESGKESGVMQQNAGTKGVSDETS